MNSVADLADTTLWQDDETVRHAFARLRSQDPVSWQGEGDGTTGYWAVVRHREVAAVSTDPGRFSSAQGTSIRTLPGAVNELLGSMLNADDPRHAQLRRVVTHTFTGRNVRVLNHHVTELATELVANARAEGGCELVASIAAPLPLRVICDLVGIPATKREAIADCSETVGTSHDPNAMLAAAQHLHDTATDLATIRRKDPRDDLTSALVHTNIDGESLRPAEIGSFFTLLVVAGSQTARHTIAGALVALDDHPDQLRWWRRSLPAATPTAVEELIRWVTPVRHFRRTATRDTELAGTTINEGDKVVIWYTSANQDETVFDRPHVLDLARTPNPHLAFGIGPHHCLGAMLARHELAAVFTALLDHPKAFRVTRSERLSSRFVSGFKSVHCQL